MKQQRSRRLGSGRLVAATTAAILVVAGAGVGSTAASGSAEPQPGGTLIVAGGTTSPWMDPAAAYSAADYQFQRMTLRGLFDYKAEGTIRTGRRHCPDLAVEIPTQENGGISEDGLTYTIQLRDGVMWNVDEPRPVVAGDVVPRRQADVQPGPGFGRT